MNGWAENIQCAIDYMEDNLTYDISMADVAARAYVSEFYFQRIFSALCGFTVGEYIRMRRLTLAGQELSRGSARVIDVAIKYGYDSPDSFARAFTRFHGITPSSAREQGAQLKSFAPVHIILKMEGGTMLEYSIVEKAAFTVVGKVKRFSDDTSYQEIPKFWLEYLHSDLAREMCGVYGVCMESNGKEFDYMIADNYVPYKEIPQGCQTRTLRAGTWAVFPCRGALPEALQSVNTAIWNQWLPGCREYKLGDNYNIEMYAPPAKDPKDNYCEIWIPVVKK